MPDDVQKRVNLDLVYRGRFNKFEEDMKRLEALQKKAESRPIRVPVILDLSQLKGQIRSAGAQIKSEIQKAVTQGPGVGQTVSKGGIITPAGFERDAQRTAGTIRSSVERVYDSTGKQIDRVITETVERAEDGQERITRAVRARKGGGPLLDRSTSVREIDPRPAQQFASALDDVRAASNRSIGKVRELGDREGELKLLQERAAQLSKTLEKSDFKKFAGTREFRRAADEVGKIQARIGTLQASLNKSAERDSFRKRLTSFQKAAQDAQGANRRVLGQAQGAKDTARELAVTEKRAKGLRQVLTSVKDQDIIGSASFRAAEGRLDRLNQRIRKLRGQSKRTDVARDLNNRIRGEEARAASLLKQNKLEAVRARKIFDATKRQSELNRLTAQRTRILDQHRARLAAIAAQAKKAQLPEIEDKAQRRIFNAENAKGQVRLDRERGRAKAVEGERKRALREQLLGLEERTKTQLAESKQQEAAANRIRRRGKREKEINRILLERRQILRAANATAAKLKGAAQRAGDSRAVNQAESLLGRNTRRAINNNDRLARSARRGGHALNFHSSSLIKNALTFTKWFLPMQVVLSVLRAFTSGVAGAVRIQRQFKTLTAVFQGSAAEAKNLERGVLALAVANGRGSDEALQAGIKFARLGLTRVQTLTLVETALKAANVAEITAAEATDKLVGIYKSFNLEVAEVPGVLDRLNALSNRYAVTVKDLFEAIARTGAIAKQSGLELKDLEGIITAVTQATGRPGQEIGSALKFVITRLRRPEILKKLEETFGIDLRDASGEVKPFSELLAELADNYQNLTRTQQAFFLDISAGARQANRFALVLDNFRTAQAASARASFDSQSALRENERIIDSVAARVESLRTEWLKLFNTLGDKGAFDAVGGALLELRDRVEILGELAGGGTQDVDISPLSRHERDLLRVGLTQAGTEESFKEFRFPTHTPLRDNLNALFLGGKISRENLERIRRTAEERLARVLNEDVAFPAPEIGGKFGFTRAELQDTTLIRDQIAIVDRLLGEIETSEAAAVVNAVTEAISDQRAEVDSLGRAAGALEGLQTDLLLPSRNITKTATTLENLFEIVQSLPNGYALAAGASRDFNEAIAQDDFERASSAIGVLVKALRDELPSAQADLASNTASTIGKVQKEYLRAIGRVQDLEESLTSTSSVRNVEIAKDIAEARKEANRFAADLRFLRESQDDEGFGLRGEGLQRFKTFFQQAEEIGEKLSEALAGSTVSGAETPDRLFARNFAAVKVFLNAVEATVEETRERLPQDILNAEGLIDLKELARLRGQLVGESRKEFEAELDAFRSAQSRKRELEGRLELKKRELLLESQISRLKQLSERGQRRGQAEALKFAVGDTEGGKLINQTRALLQRGATFASVTAIRAFPVPGQEEKDITGVVEARGQALSQEAVIRNNLNSLEQRQAQITADRLNNEIELRNTLREQTEEAGRKLQLATREEQLRAATLAEATRGERLSTQDFFALSQAARQTATQFLPGAVPAGLDRTRSEAGRQDQRLREEQAQIATVIGEFRERLASLSGVIDRAFSLDRRVPGLQGEALQDVINLETGEINVQLDFSSATEEIGALLRDQVLAHLDAEIAEVRALIQGNPAGAGANVN